MLATIIQTAAVLAIGGAALYARHQWLREKARADALDSLLAAASADPGRFAAAALRNVARNTPAEARAAVLDLAACDLIKTVTVAAYYESGQTLAPADILVPLAAHAPDREQAADLDREAREVIDLERMLDLPAYEEPGDDDR